MIASCGACGSSTEPDASYCESCGADLRDAIRTAAWAATVCSDRAYFDRLEAGGLQFPATVVERAVPLTGERLMIGRRTASRPERPDVDLSEPPADTGVSHIHAVLARSTDGSWTIADCGSTNGTYLNDGDDPIHPGEPIVLADGDRVHLGAWTTITIRQVPPSP